ncbi:MAG: RNA polymerase sigma factor [Solirubrobacteraceae bacterium]
MDLALLIEQIRQGDETAGAVLVSIVAPRLLGYADLIGPDLPEVDRELAVESAIETAIRKIGQYDESRGTFPAWVRTFVKNAVNDWRRRHPDGAPGELVGEPEQPAEPPDDATEAVDPETIAIAAIVLTESEPNQLLIRLRFVDGLTHAQIAERLNVTEAASRKRLERLLAGFRRRGSEDPDLSGHLKGDEDDEQ